MIRWIMIAVGAMGVFCGAVAMGQGEPARRPGLSVRDGSLIRDGRPYRGVGANYYDLLLRLLRDPADRSSLEGLARLSEAGIPFVRFAGPYSVKEWEWCFEGREDYLRRLDMVVQAAERARIGLIPSMFWTPVLPDTVGEQRDQWGNPESKTMARMRQHVADVVHRYKDSPAIWAWEFGNEFNLAVDLPNAPQFRRKGGTERDDLKSEHMVVALSEFAKEVRRHDGWRAVFSGHSHPRPSAWHNTRERSWKPDNREQFRQIILRDNPAPLDTIGVHVYGGRPVEEEMSAWTNDRAEWFRTLKAIARESGRPVFVGEFGLAASEDKTAARAIFEELISSMEQAGVDLAAFWVFDLPAQNGTWNVTFDNDRAWMIELTAQANRRWNRAALE